MPPVLYKARVENIVQHTPEVRELTFRLLEPSTIDYRAGQYLNFRIPAPDKPNGVSRLYSISSSPSEAGIVRVLYTYVGGIGTMFLQSLSEGDRVEFKAPFGRFCLREDSDRDICCVATGTGVSPFISYAFEHVPHLAAGRKFTLLWGVRHMRDVYMVDRFRELETRYSNFKLLLTLSRPEPEWDGLKGRVTEQFPKFFPSVDNVEVYTCGSEEMMNDIRALCEQLGGCPYYREKWY